VSELDEVDLERPEEEPEPRRGSRAIWLALPILLLGGAALTGYLLVHRDRPSPAPKAPAPALEPAPAVPPAAREEAPVEDTALPSLEESDKLFRELARQVSSHPRLASWLTTRGLIRTVTVVVSNVAEGVSPAKHVPFLAPSEPFPALERGPRAFLDPKGYARYDFLAEVVESIDTSGSARLYRQLRPLFGEAYRELGHPAGNFDAALEQALRRVVETPVVEGQIALTRDAVSFEYADPRLESLSAAQKHFLRMGPRNLRRIQRKVRELAAELGFRL
jgi:hypothetical protein